MSEIEGKPCEACDQTGKLMPEGCEECDGNGWVDDPNGGYMTCPECNGDAGESCPECEDGYIY